jgi:hypothetical protein
MRGYHKISLISVVVLTLLCGGWFWEKTPERKACEAISSYRSEYVGILKSKRSGRLITWLLSHGAEWEPHRLKDLKKKYSLELNQLPPRAQHLMFPDWHDCAHICVDGRYAGIRDWEHWCKQMKEIERQIEVICASH